jgi:hypothetical protein
MEVAGGELFIADMIKIMQLWNCNVRWDSDRDYRDGCIINIVYYKFWLWLWFAGGHVLSQLNNCINSAIISRLCA